MTKNLIRFLSRGSILLTRLLAIVLSIAISSPVHAMNAVRGGNLPQPLPLFPSDNWWNLDISNWPVDANSASYITFINNGGMRRLHPDFGGDASTPQNPYAIYGMPFAVVSGVTGTDLVTVEFQYSDESDGVDHGRDHRCLQRNQQDG